MSFTAAQRTALSYPCLLAEETAHPRFGRRIGRRATLLLTINAGYE
jgi:hypothetical protein